MEVSRGLKQNWLDVISDKAAFDIRAASSGCGLRKTEDAVGAGGSVAQ